MLDLNEHMLKTLATITFNIQSNECHSTIILFCCCVVSKTNQYIKSIQVISHSRLLSIFERKWWSTLCDLRVEWFFLHSYQSLKREPWDWKWYGHKRKILHVDNYFLFNFLMYYSFTKRQLFFTFYSSFFCMKSQLLMEEATTILWLKLINLLIGNGG